MNNETNSEKNQSRKIKSVDLFQCRWDALLLEIQIINNIIGRVDSITQTTKNWAVITWAGSIALFLGQEDLIKYLAATAFLPIIFWVLDSQWRRLQRRSIFRVERISEFLSDGNRVRSLSNTSFDDMAILDPVGRKYRGKDEYNEFASLSKTMWYKEVYIMYLAMFLISLMGGVCTLFKWIP